MTTILICDDHPVVASGLCEVFAQIVDFQVVGLVQTAREIGPAIHGLRPDLVFLDINMDGENQVERLAEFREIRLATRFVMFSSYNLPSLASRAFSEGADAYLLKSSSRAEILAACEAVGKNRKFIGAEVSLRKADRLKIMGEGHVPLDQFEALHRLTEKEKLVFHLVAEGKTEAEIAEKMTVSKHTVHSHRKNLMAKLGLHSSADFVRFSNDIG